MILLIYYINYFYSYTLSCFPKYMPLDKNRYELLTSGCSLSSELKYSICLYFLIS